MTEVKPYPEYKDSGVDWLRSIPTDWASAQVRRVATIVNGGTPGPDGTNWNGHVNWATPVDLNAADGGSIDYTQRTLTSAGLASGSASVLPGSIVLSTRAPIGYSALCMTEMAFNQGCKGLMPRSSVRPQYLLFVMQAAKGELSRRGQGTTFLELSGGSLASVMVPLPSVVEQDAIATFLDRETAEIDAFVADQEELIALLAERRAATITHAVTKGLDPSVPMKDSGVEWLGEIPECWDAQKLGWLARIGNGSTPSRENPLNWIDGTIPWLSSTVVNQQRVEAAAEFVTTEARRLCHLPTVRAGSLLVGLTGQGRTRGMAARLAFDSTISQHLAFVETRTGLDSDYAFWLLVSAYAHLRFQSDGNGGTKGGLTCEELASLRIPVPPSLEEQQATARYLDHETAEIDATIADAREAIALLRERRAALISAAVTGKIDVRGRE